MPIERDAIRFYGELFRISPDLAHRYAQRRAIELTAVARASCHFLIDAPRLACNVTLPNEESGNGRRFEPHA